MKKIGAILIQELPDSDYFNSVGKRRLLPIVIVLQRAIGLGQLC